MKKYLLAMTILSIVLIFAGCSRFTGNTEEGATDGETTTAMEVPVEQEQPKAIPIEAYEVKTGPITEYRNFGGDVYPVTTMAVLPEMTGKIAAVMVKEGDTVAKDQVIARIDPSKPGMNYNLSDVKAPMAGTILTLSAPIGGMAAPSASLGTIISTDDLEIRFDVVERYLSEVRQGQKALVTFDAYPDETFEATVTRLNPIMDGASRTRTIYTSLDKQDSRIIAGMYAKIKLVIDHKDNSILIPISAILTQEDRTFVYTIEDSVAHVTPVTIGIQTDGISEIVEGLTSGMTIAVKGQNMLSEGTAVSISSTMEGDK